MKIFKNKREIPLFWWVEKYKGGLQNYGDALSPYIIERLSGKKTNVINPKSFRYKYLRKHVFCIGSILGQANKMSIIWGSGIVLKDQVVKCNKVLAVRGPKTRDRLMQLGYSVPEIYGDPALLLPLIYIPKVTKQFKLGIIPHYVDYEHILNNIQEEKEVKVINLLTDDVEKTTDQILSCHTIISSSLHGVIVAHAYGIPAIWVKFSNKLFGDDVKFHDYFESVGLYNIPVIEVSEDISSKELLKITKEYKLNSLPNNKLLQRNQKNLQESFFDEIKISI